MIELAYSNIGIFIPCQTFKVVFCKNIQLLDSNNNVHEKDHLRYFTDRVLNMLLQIYFNYI